MKRIVLYIALIIIAVGCTEDEIKVFGDMDYLYFDIDDKEGALIDENGYLEYYYSFVLEFDDAVETKTLKIPVKIAGTPKDTDRKISFVVIDSLSNAVEGEHFEIINENFFKAGNVKDSLEIRLFKTTDMIENPYELSLQLLDNEELKAGPQHKIKVVFDNDFQEPYWWPNPDADLGIGVYTRVKCLLWMKFHDVLDGSDPWDRSPYIKYVEVNGQFQPVYQNDQRSRSISEFIRFVEKGDEDGNDYIDENGNRVIDTI